MTSGTTHASTVKAELSSFAIIIYAIIMDHDAIEIDASKKEELEDFLYKYWPDTIEVIVQRERELHSNYYYI